MTEYDQLKALTTRLSKTIDQAQRMLDQFKLAPKSKRVKRYALVVLDELVRKARGVLAMIEAGPGAWAGVSSVARSAFESYADLINLLRYGEEYTDFMDWMSLNQQRSFYQSAVDVPESEFSESLAQGLRENGHPEPGEILARTREGMAIIADSLPRRYKGKKDVRRGESFRFELAGLRNEYDFLYRRLSAGSHGRVSDISGELDFIDDSHAFEWPPRGPFPPLVAVDSYVGFLIDACRQVAKQYKKPLAPFNVLGREQMRFRTEIE